MSAYKSKILKFYRSKKINVLAVFILLALIFSLLTKLSRDYTRTISFDIEMINVPDEFVVLNDSTHVVDITLSTYGFNMIKYYFSNSKLDVDFSSLKKVQNKYLWTKNEGLQEVVNQFDASTFINSISPDSIFFSFDVNYVKTVPIILNEEIEFASGFDIINQYYLRPDSVKVIGAKSLVDSISSIRTELLELKNINSEVNTTIALDIPEGLDEIKFSEEIVSVSAEVTKFTEGSQFVPVNITNLPDDVNIKFFPKEVEVIFYTSMKDFRTISPGSFMVECDYRDLETNNAFLVPKLVKQPKSVKNVRLGIKKIEFILMQ